jgi:tRNA A37 threonylcarbamoyladenosine modification protein TsaB
VSTLDVIGYQASGRRETVWAVLPAGRGEVYFAAYAGLGETWHRASEYRIARVEELAAAADVGVLLAGEGADEVLAATSSRLLAIEPTTASGLRRAAYLAELGRRYLEHSGPSQLDLLEPLYLRRSAAEEKRAVGHAE